MVLPLATAVQEFRAAGVDPAFVHGPSEPSAAIFATSTSAMFLKSAAPFGL